MKKILVVDDDANFLSALSAQLAVGDEYEVDGATSGKQAIEHIRDHHPDIVVLDLNLPDIQGYEVLQSSKEGSKERKTKFVVCTNYDSKENQLTCKELGAEEYFVKAEYTLEELVDKIAAVINRK